MRDRYVGAGEVAMVHDEHLHGPKCSWGEEPRHIALLGEIRLSGANLAEGCPLVHEWLQSIISLVVMRSDLCAKGYEIAKCQERMTRAVDSVDGEGHERTEKELCGLETDTAACTYVSTWTSSSALQRWKDRIPVTRTWTSSKPRSIFEAWRTLSVQKVGLREQE